jgi:hypothetical protein
MEENDLKKLLDEAETGLSKPNSWRMLMMMMMMISNNEADPRGISRYDMSMYRGHSLR